MQQLKTSNLIVNMVEGSHTSQSLTIRCSDITYHEIHTNLTLALHKIAWGLATLYLLKNIKLVGLYNNTYGVINNDRTNKGCHEIHINLPLCHLCKLFMISGFMLLNKIFPSYSYWL